MLLELQITIVECHGPLKEKNDKFQNREKIVLPFVLSSSNNKNNNNNYDARGGRPKLEVIK